MNNNYYRENKFPGAYIPDQNIMNNKNITLENTIRDTENFISSNIGKRAKIYMSFPDSIEWRDKIFSGVILSVGLDYLLIKDLTNTPVLLQKIYINYIEFDESVNY